MTDDIARWTETWNHREKSALIGLLAEGVGVVPPSLLAEARLRAAEAAEKAIEKEIMALIDEYVRSSELERAAQARRDPDAATLRGQTAEIAARHRRQQKLLAAARAVTAFRRAEWEAMR